MRRLPSMLLAATLVLTAGAAPLAAQGLTDGEGPLRSSGAITVGPILGVNFPSGDLTDATNTGLTFGGQVTYGLGVAALLGEVTYTNFTGKLEGDIEHADISSVGFAAGARASIPVWRLYVGGLAGWWTDADEFDIVPLVGFHVGPADIGARYKGLLGDADWFSVTGAVHFRLR